MRPLPLLRFTLTFVLLALPAPGWADKPIDGPAVDALVREALKAWEAPGAAIAIVRNGEVVYLQGYGVKALARSEPVTPDTVFAIASTSKAFTTTAIALLADDGKLSWDDPVRKHVTYFRLSDELADQNVTLRDLVTHRTGLSRHDMLWHGSPWGREEIIRRIAHVKPSKPFRSAYQYQNIMYLTAGQAVGAASQSSWEEFVQKRIFAPLGMTGASFSTLAAEKAPDRATPHGRFEDQIEPIPWRNIDNIGPAGSINAGVRDLSKWVRFQLGDGTFDGKRLLSARRLAELHSPQMVIDMEGPTGVPSYSKQWNPETNMMSYGLGWTVQDYRGQLLVSHGGSIDGFRAQVALVPKAKLGIVVLSNLGRTQLPEAVRNNLIDHLLALPTKDWNAHYRELLKQQEARQKKREEEREAKRHKDTKPSRDLEAYTGAYEDPAYGKASVAMADGALVLEWSSFKAKLEHFHFDTFRARAEKAGASNGLDKETVLFALGGDGEVATMTLFDQAFKKVKK